MIKLVQPGDGNKHRRHRVRRWIKNTFVGIWEPEENWTLISVSISVYNKERTDIINYEFADCETRREAAKWLKDHRHMIA
jgi:hypothetical protein